MPEPSLEMVVALQRSPLDERRGIVRLHPQVLGMLGVQPWDPLSISGARVTGVLAAKAGPLVPRSTILMDEIGCRNAGTSPGERVRVARADAQLAQEVVLRAGAEDSERLDPFAIRFALLGKIVTAGDNVSILPQDFDRPEGLGVDLETLMRYLSYSYGSDWQSLMFQVVSTGPSGLVRITMETVVTWEGEIGTEGLGTTDSATPLSVSGMAPKLSDLPGHEAALEQLRELLDLAFHHADVLDKLGARPQLGVLITGPPGSGKVAVVMAVAAAVGARVLRLWGPALARLDLKEASSRLTDALSQAKSSTPCVLLIEDVDALVPRQESGPHADVLLQTVAEAAKHAGIAAVCTTAHPEATSPDLRKPGLLEQEIAITMPTREQRRAILDVLTRGLPLDADADLDGVAARTPGFVAADLLALCREASMRSAQRAVAVDKRDAPSVSGGDFEAALEVVRPSSMEGSVLLVPDVSLEDVGDMEATKKELTEAVIWPIRYPDTFVRLGVDPPRGILLYGPPGCGKTFLMKGLANEAEANFLAVKGAELLSMWVGESERGVRELFRRARSAAPTIMFFDELDALAPARGRSQTSVTDSVVASLLTELDGVEELRDVFVIGATNRPDLIDAALLRPGRLERLVYVPPPDEVARGAILRAATRNMPLAPEIDLDAIGAECDGFSAADLEALARQAAMTAMRENMQAPMVTSEHFESAHGSVGPSIDPAQARALESFGRAAPAVEK